MVTARHVRWTAVRDGAGVALCVVVPVVLLAMVAGDALGLDAGSNLVFALYLVLVAGMVAGGWVAARRGLRRAPVAHAVLAALAAYALVGGGGALLRLVAGRDIQPLALAFNGLVALAAGIAGGLLESADGLRRSPSGADASP